MDDNKLQRSADAARQMPGRRKSEPAASVPTPAAPSMPRPLSEMWPEAAPRADFTEAAVVDRFPYAVAKRFGFLGAGQGGSKIADAFWRLGYARSAAFNTTEVDTKALDPDLPRLILPIGGARKDMTYARSQLSGREEEVRELLAASWGKELDYGMICVGLGGGTGSGTALPLIQIARGYMRSRGLRPRVGAVVALPSPDDGQLIARNALTALQELVRARVSPLIILDNARVNERFQPGLANLYPMANQSVAMLLHMFNRLAAVRSETVSFDQSELEQVLDSGTIVMGRAAIPLTPNLNPNSIATAVRGPLVDNVLAPVEMGLGTVAGLVFVASSDVLQKLNMDYFAAGFSALERLVGQKRQDIQRNPTVVHRGIYRPADLDSDEPGQPDPRPETLSCYAIVGGLTPAQASLQRLATVANLTAETRQAFSVASYLGVDDGPDNDSLS